MLPDDVLLEIFDFHADEAVDEAINEAIVETDIMHPDTGYIKKPIIEGWITLVHVCQRWRSVIFQSPRRFNLRLLCLPETPAKDTLDIWPPLPLIVEDHYGASFGADNILAALEHNHHVCQIELLCEPSSELECYTNSAAMQKPFPKLTHLLLRGPSRSSGSTLPDSFLGGNAPRLRSLELDCIPFPGLPKLLLSATHLIHLDLFDIPPSGYIPPEALATSFSALTNLESLNLHFLSPRPRPALDSRRPPPMTHSILPSLTEIEFKGTSDYLEEILARIDAPRLDRLDITFFNDILFDTSQLPQFISRIPALRSPKKGHVTFDYAEIVVEFNSQTSGYHVLRVRILCSAPDWQLSSIEQVFTPSFPPLSTLEDLYIFDDSDRYYPRPWQDDVENTLWLEVLHRFAAVKNLYLCEEIAPSIGAALQELVGARTTEELPTLENIFLEGLQPSGPAQEGIEKFLTARQLTSRPIAVSRWDRNLDP